MRDRHNFYPGRWTTGTPGWTIGRLVVGMIVVQTTRTHAQGWNARGGIFPKGGTGIIRRVVWRLVNEGGRRGRIGGQREGRRQGMGQRRGQQSRLAAAIGLRFGNQGLLLIGRWFHEPLGPFGGILGMNRIVLHIGGRFVVIVVMVVLHGIGAARRIGRSLLLCYRLLWLWFVIIVFGMRFLHVIAMGLWCATGGTCIGGCGGRGTFPRGLPGRLVIIIRLAGIGIDRGLPSRRQQHGRRRRSSGGTIFARGGSDGIGRLGRGGRRLR